MHTIQTNKYIAGLMIVLCMVGGNGILIANATTSAPFVHAASACLLDVDSGRILYEKNGHEPRKIASLTKVVTGWIAIKSNQLDKMVTVSANAARQEGSSVYLRIGEKVKVRDLLYAMMMRSGNDAATSIAEAVAGSTDQFAKLMNQEVTRLHLKNTHFANPHGLDQNGHYASADDFAVLTGQALKNPLFRQVVSTKYYRISRSTEMNGMRLKNKNKLLWMMQNADGVKTGYTKAAGRCLAASASLGGRQVVLVLLDDPSDWNDAKALLSYGLQVYQKLDVASIRQKEYLLPIKDGVRTSIASVPQAPVFYPLREDESSALVYHITPTKQKAPIRAGQKIGVLYVSLHQQLIGKTMLIAKEDMPAKSWWGKLKGLFR